MKADLYYNLKDPYAMTFKKEFEGRMIGKSKQKSLHPNFEHSISKIIGLHKHSYVEYTWSNDYKYKCYLHDGFHSVPRMYQEMKIYNDICDNQKIIEGAEEDEDDEAKVLF
eukprot:CAMPEP_0170519108 /NCGR_PEP_ID=MMETSP0209-20121228/4636_1 /TAXON_ID=665100 ORGANISM="Litonotus pictus, Strain P1" /NCGR_SAMPLE_ID=MMETSP0209 /ASSEMBLY_ACC=CAM_ASM_000301 /LENGTH=110 /DNA_ID=CAMNT_0010804907 /DNA_START=62 /DNA_END=394 /DNA_ORIENTATION=+